ncbi:Protein phosphatase inhibitor 2 family member C [Bienertia sinuspersici]
MSGTPTEICVALGLLLSKISDIHVKERRRAFKVKNREHMIKRVLVYSDMEFDKASERPLETNNYNGFKVESSVEGLEGGGILLWRLLFSSNEYSKIGFLD